MLRHTRVQGAIVRDGQVLLIKHREHGTGHEYWLLPGGGAEAGETDEVCLAREVEEETHLRVAVGRLLLDEPAADEGGYRRYRTFLCRPLEGEARPGHEPEAEAAAVYAIAAVAWVPLRDESAWDPQILADRLTYPLLGRLRSALGVA